MTDFLQELINGNWKIQPVFVENGWLEFDNISDYEIYTMLYDTGKLHKYFDLNSN